jgi:hypothetical protein
VARDLDVVVDIHPNLLPFGERIGLWQKYGDRPRFCEIDTQQGELPLK